MQPRAIKVGNRERYFLFTVAMVINIMKLSGNVSYNIQLPKCCNLSYHMPNLVQRLLRRGLLSKILTAILIFGLLQVLPIFPRGWTPLKWKSRKNYTRNNLHSIISKKHKWVLKAAPLLLGVMYDESLMRRERWEVTDWENHPVLMNCTQKFDTLEWLSYTNMFIRHVAITFKEI